MPVTRGLLYFQQTFTPAELAAICRVGSRTVTNWADAGMPHLRTPRGHRRFRRSELTFLPPAGDPQLLTADDIAAMLRVHPGTVAVWWEAGDLECVRLPVYGAPRARRSDVDELLRRQACG
jgi:hypothetical protein